MPRAIVQQRRSTGQARYGNSRCINVERIGMASTPIAEILHLNLDAKISSAWRFVPLCFNEIERFMHE